MLLRIYPGKCVSSRRFSQVQMTLIITLSTDRRETESLLTNSSASFVLTRHQPDICRQLLARVSSLTGTDWVKKNATHSSPAQLHIPEIISLQQTQTELRQCAGFSQSIPFSHVISTLATRWSKPVVYFKTCTMVYMFYFNNNNYNRSQLF